MQLANKRSNQCCIDITRPVRVTNKMSNFGVLTAIYQLPDLNQTRRRASERLEWKSQSAFGFFGLLQSIRETESSFVVTLFPSQPIVSQVNDVGGPNCTS